MGKYRDSPPGIIATSAKSGRLQNEDTWLTWRFLYKDLTNWLGHVPFRTEELWQLWKEGYQSCFTWTPGLSFSFSLSSASSAVPHASSSTPALVRNPRGSNDSNDVLPNARYNSRTRIHNTCCIICHSKSWQPPHSKARPPEIRV